MSYGNEYLLAIGMCGVEGYVAGNILHKTTKSWASKVEWNYDDCGNNRVKHKCIFIWVRFGYFHLPLAFYSSGVSLFLFENLQGGLAKKRVHYVEGGQAGNREEKIDNLIRAMNWAADYAGSDHVARCIAVTAAPAFLKDFSGNLYQTMQMLPWIETGSVFCLGNFGFVERVWLWYCCGVVAVDWTKL